MAIATDRLTDPRGNNAVEYFRAVLALQPDNADARTGLEAVGAAARGTRRRSTASARSCTRCDCAHDLAARGSRVPATRRATSRTRGALAQHARAGQRCAAACAGETARRARASAPAQRSQVQAPTPRSRSNGSSRARRRSPVQVSSNPSRDCAVEAFCSNRRATMLTSNCSRYAPSIRRRTSFAPSSSSSRSRSWNGRALPLRPATWKRHALSSAASTRWPRTWTRPNLCRRNWQPRSSSATLRRKSCRRKR